MSDKNKKLLELAKRYTYEMKMSEAYHIFRRFFDRIPFGVEREHAEYMAMFSRVLIELGKIRELQFYLNELEKWDRREPSPAVKFQLGIIYSYLEQPKPEKAKNMFEEVLRVTVDKRFRIRAKMMLASYYDTKGNDRSMSHTVIASLEDSDEPELQTLVEIWRAKMLREQRQFAAVETKLLALLAKTSFESDWYGYFNLMIALAFCYLQGNQHKKVKPILNELKRLFEGKPVKTVMLKIEALEREMEETRYGDKITFFSKKGGGRLEFGKRKLELSDEILSDRLLLAFLSKRTVNKELVVSTLYNRSYLGKSDDNAIHYHIYLIRRRLGALGLSESSIKRSGGSYRFAVPVEIGSEEE